jgi:hypothetical protein
MKVAMAEAKGIGDSAGAAFPRPNSAFPQTNLMIVRLSTTAEVTMA